MCGAWQDANLTAPEPEWPGEFKWVALEKDGQHRVAFAMHSEDQGWHLFGQPLGGTVTHWQPLSIPPVPGAADAVIETADQAEDRERREAFENFTQALGPNLPPDSKLLAYLERILLQPRLQRWETALIVTHSVVESLLRETLGGFFRDPEIVAKEGFHKMLELLRALSPSPMNQLSCEIFRALNSARNKVAHHTDGAEALRLLQAANTRAQRENLIGVIPTTDPLSLVFWAGGYSGGLLAQIAGHGRSHEPRQGSRNDQAPPST